MNNISEESVDKDKKQEISIDLNQLDNSSLFRLYGSLISELKKRHIIRTKNIVGDLGERAAIDYYTKTPHLENLQDAPANTKNIDAIGDKGNRYAIKSLTGNRTSVFYGLPSPDSAVEPIKIFDYLLIVKFSDNYEITAIYELDWQTFLQHKQWAKWTSSWFMTLSEKVKNAANQVYYPTDEL